jgi:glutamine synthetase
VLAKVLDRLARKGIHPVVAFELEFYLFDKKLATACRNSRDELTDDADDQPNMHIERLSRFAPVLDDMVEATRAQGIDATVITAELGPGQFEINFGHLDDGLRAADWAALFCRSTRGVALKHGYRASFMAKPYLQHPGSGMHVHVSLYDAAGNNLLAANHQQPLRHAVAGCLDLLPHSMPIFAPNQNAMRRLGGTVNAATKASWGSRTATPACASPSRTRKTCASNIAWPAPTPTRIWCWRRFWWAGAWPGIRQGTDPALNDDRNSGIDFPTEILDAVRAMQHQPTACGTGREFVDVYCENKRQDHLAFMQEISAREYRWYL